ncbi:four helix bundle protein [Desulfoplanes sp. PS50]
MPARWNGCYTAPSFEGFHRVKKRACRLAVRLYELLQGCRDYGLKDQITRAAVSIPSNTCPVK